MKAKSMYCIALILLGSIVHLTAQDHTISSPSLQHMMTVNAEWDKYPDAIHSEAISFSSDEDRIAFHLTKVIAYLSQHGSPMINNKAAANRSQLLSQLQSYAEAKVFPKNTFHAQRQPYFIDSYGTHCAVGYLMQASGHEALAQKIKSEQNYDYLKDIKTEGIQDWADEHGFTTDELAWIQPGYPPVLPINTLEGGTNGEVNTMLRDYSSGDIYIAGTFDVLNELPCLNLGVYRDDQLECLGNGIAGKINDLYAAYNEPLYVVGHLENQGSMYSLALYDDESNTWQYINIETREGAEATCIAYNNDEQAVELSIINPSNPTLSEVWQLSDEGDWTMMLTVNGVINDLLRGGTNEMVYAGQFDMVTIPSGMGAPDEIVYVNNVVIKSELNWSGLEGDISDHVNVINYYGNTYYFGGSCSTSSTSSDACISRYFNGVLQPLLLAQSFVEGDTSENVINDILFSQDVMYLAGDFNISPFVGIYGSGLASYSLSGNYIEALADFDAPVNCLLAKSSNIYLGGAFTENLNNEINYLAHVDFASSTTDINDEKTLTIYPNPVVDIINIKGLDEPFSYSIYDLSGRLVSAQNRMGYNVDLPSIESGIYFLNVMTQDGKAQTLKFVKD